MHSPFMELQTSSYPSISGKPTGSGPRVDRDIDEEE
jgi:hypothetical protein